MGIWDWLTGNDDGITGTVADNTDGLPSAIAPGSKWIDVKPLSTSDLGGNILSPISNVIAAEDEILQYLGNIKREEFRAAEEEKRFSKFTRDETQFQFAGDTLLTTTQLSGGTATINVKDNVLSEYESSTYKWTLYAGHPDTHNNKDFTNLVIIAESGASGDYHITDMEVNSVLGYNPKTRAMPFSSFDFTIEEPQGATLMDRLASVATNDLGVSNYQMVPYYLELSFFGDDGKINVVNRGLKWSVKLVTMNMSVNESGAVYTFSAVVADDIGAANDISVMPETFVINGADTISTLFVDLEDKLNKYAAFYTGILFNESDQYKFDIDPQIAALSISPSDVSQETQRNRDNDVGTLNTIHVAIGTDISEVITNLMVLCEGWQPFINVSNITGESTAGVEFSKLWKVETSVKYLNFDTLRNDYAKEYTFHVTPYTVLRSNINATSEEKLRRAKELSSVFPINKIYDYIYTGTNTEVLHFDFNLDLIWHQELPFGLEQLRQDGSDVELGTYINTAKTIKQNISGLQQQLSTATSGSAGGVLLSQLEAASLALTSLVNPITGLTVGETLAQGIENRANLTASVRNFTADTFIEDIAAPTFEEWSNSPPRQITRARTDITQIFGLEGKLTHTQNAIANYLAYHGSPEMTQSTLEIKGDPYWFGVNKFMKTTPIVGGSSEGTPDIADFMHNDNIFIIRMNAPTKADDNGIINTPTNNKLYTAVYQVIEATHKFSNGMYTTQLSAVKDTQTDVSDLLKGI